MEQTNHYIEDISKDLSFIPEEHLATIRDMIRLIAMPYKEEVTQEENIVDKELLQGYIREVREGFGLYFEETKKLNASYHIGENLTYACFSVVEVDIFEEEMKDLETSMEELLEEKEVPKEVFEQKLTEKEKVSLYEENTFYIVKHTKPELWQAENAQEDAKEEIGKVLAKLPNYNEEENIVNKELLQVYADKFRKGFKLLMKKDLGLNFSFQIEEKYTLLKLTNTNLEEEKAEIEEIKEYFDLYTLLKQENLALIEYHSTAREQIKYKIRSLDEDDNFRDDDSEKASIFTEEGIYLLDISEPEKWTEEQAIIDRRNLLGLMFKNLPAY